MPTLVHRFRASIRAIGIAAVVLMLTAQSVAAYTGDTYDPTPGVRHWPLNAVLTYAFLPGSEPPAWMKPLIRREIAHLNSGTQRARLPIFRYTTDASVAHLKIGYGIPTDPNVAPCGGHKTIICVSRIPTTEQQDAVLLFAKDALDGSPYPWQKWCQFPGALPSHHDRCFDVSHITLRGMGFVYGLQRWDKDPFGNFGPGARITVMSPWARRQGLAGFDRVDYGVCDVARLQLLYDVLNDTTRYSTCLDRQATNLELGASDQSIGFHDPVTFKARLKLDVLEPAVFVGNLVSHRRVVLQRSTDGFVTFDSRVMDPGPHGLYTFTTHPEASASYRAVFDTPEHEGLLGDTSNVVDVFVAPPPPGP